jgi:hypothetical protein
MKTLLLCFLFLVAVTGCAGTTFTTIPKTYSVYDADLTKYSQQNFLFTPYEYQGKYEPIGLIQSVGIYQGVRLDTIKHFGRQDLRVVVVSYSVQYCFDKLSIGELLDSVYLRYSKKGANAIINFRIEPISKRVEGRDDAPSVVVHGFSLSGYAIKRID